ncbi:amino acid kinase family protein [Streptomyces longispororuber]|nr:carbamate kinase [Streptomyces longispororuber]
MRIVISLGGNALSRRSGHPDGDGQAVDTDRVTTTLVGLALQHEVVIVHGNGPRTGPLAEESAAGPAPDAPYPPDLSGAQAQGAIGSLLVRALYDVLPGHRVAALVTHTLVRADDPAFDRPTEFVGPVYSREIADVLARRHHWHIAQDGGGWRRVVPSPLPERVLETETVHALLGHRVLVVCAGGGGIAVTADHDTGALTSVEAVVDKDLAAAVLAEDLKADFLLLLTDVPCVYAGTGTRGAQPVLDTTPEDLRRRSFPAASMGTKAEAAARFVERTGALAAIGALDAAYEIVHGRSGTLVCRDLTAA